MTPSVALIGRSSTLGVQGQSRSIVWAIGFQGFGAYVLTAMERQCSMVH